MTFYADLHIHSKYSRATSKQCDLENLSIWAAKKGISVIGTGDFTHPAWFAEIKEKLRPAEPGLFRLAPPLEREVAARVGPGLEGETRFTLTVEISTIYKRDGKTRKVHHVIHAPDVESADRFRRALDRIGNIKSDGRPILGLPSRDLLEIALESGQDSFLVPAHIWTPWFSAMGSKSGYDSIDECYGDLASHIFAVETGLSSDPPMNWRLSSLDKYRLVSSSDAHSPAKLGRECCVFNTEMDYFAMKRALETGDNYGGTIEMFPEEGKYHADGHRKCGVRLDPVQTKEAKGVCPKCGKPLTIGVLYRVEELADRAEGVKPKGAGDFRGLIPLAEVIAEILGKGPATKGVMKTYEALVSRVGPELFILNDAPLEDVARLGSETMAEAVSRMREGRVIREAGFDGEYGVIKLFEEGELKGSPSAGLLFELPKEEELPRVGDDEKDEENRAPSEAKPKTAQKVESCKKPQKPAAQKPLFGVDAILSGLDEEQLQAAKVMDGPLLIVAGPGAGKTRTLTHRVAHLVAKGIARPDQCLVITFTRRAAHEALERLEALLPEHAGSFPVMTFHALGLKIIEENSRALGLGRRVRVASETERVRILMDSLGLTRSKAEKALGKISGAKGGTEPEEGVAESLGAYEKGLAARGMVDFDDLISMPLELFSSQPGLAERYRDRWPWPSIDEYQDVDERQYGLVKALAAPDSAICAIGDPDQSIYGFRGADVGFFLRFKDDFPGAKVVELERNYRSGGNILEASLQAIAPASLVEGRSFKAAISDPGGVVLHRAPTEAAEAENAVHQIEKLIGGHTFFSIDSGRTEQGREGDYSFSDFAVLYRTEALAAPLVEAFSRSGIPFQKRSHDRLLARPGVAEIIAAIGKAGGETLEGRLESAARFLVDGGEKDGPEREVVDDALELLKYAARSHSGDEAGFINALAMGAEVDAWDPRADRVSLMTLHASKGLEWPVVFIVGLEDGILPFRFARDKAADVDEERRLLFVGMTRAMERLYLSHSARRAVSSKVSRRRPSPFLEEIEKDLLEMTASEKRKKKEPPRAEQLKLF